MKNRKYSLVFIMLLCMIMAVSAFPMTVNADMGPKASVRIQFEHMGDELCYGTLLSKEKSTGPAISEGVNHCISPSQYDFIVVSGVPPPITTAKSFINFVSHSPLNSGNLKWGTLRTLFSLLFAIIIILYRD